MCADTMTTASSRVVQYLMIFIETEHKAILNKECRGAGSRSRASDAAGGAWDSSEFKAEAGTDDGEPVGRESASWDVIHDLPVAVHASHDGNVRRRDVYRPRRWTATIRRWSQNHWAQRGDVPSTGDPFPRSGRPDLVQKQVRVIARAAGASLGHVQDT